jgi:hypothetical protein
MCTKSCKIIKHNGLLTDKSMFICFISLLNENIIRMKKYMTRTRAGNMASGAGGEGGREKRFGVLMEKSYEIGQYGKTQA